MSKKKQKILIFFLFSFSIYCALIIGQTWDEGFHLAQGKITLEYLFSLGRINNDIYYREFYSPIYWTLQYFLTKIFPINYQIEASHLVNLIFSLGVIIGIGKVAKELFNASVGRITFLILFFYPVFFGHMAINSKDTILAFSHVWIFFFSLKYLKEQNVIDRSNKYILLTGVLAALSTGIQLAFIGSLIPIFLFILAEIFFFKKIVIKKFNKKKFLFDFLKCFIIFYLLLTLFWIDVHGNIFILPYNIINQTFTSDYITGWPFNLVNGHYYLSNEISKLYLITNFLFKTPEYILISYIFFIFLFFKKKNYFNKEFLSFNYKLSLIVLILSFPNLLLFILPYPVYDGMRLFLWIVPYLCLIPALTIYYFIENLKTIKSKIFSILLSFFILYFLYNFFSITPYHYTYLNFLNGDTEFRYKKFEGDYWGSSIKELINNSDFEKNKSLSFATCGVNPAVVKNYLNKKGYTNFNFKNPDQANYIIMTNRVVAYDLQTEISNKLTNCFDKYKGKNVFKVSRNGLLLSVIRKI